MRVASNMLYSVTITRVYEFEADSDSEAQQKVEEWDENKTNFDLVDTHEDYLLLNLDDFNEETFLYREVNL